MEGGRDRRVVRAGAGYGLITAGLGGAFALGTWGEPHRGVMLAVVAVMMASAVVGFVASGRIGPSRWSMPVQMAGALVSLTGSAALGILAGGVAGPLGAFIPLTVVLRAIVLPPRAFLVMTGYAAGAYALVVEYGGAAPPGYALVHALGFGCAAVLCLRHAGALASLRHRLAEASRTDPLTGCLNRRGFDERVAAELAAADRDGTPVTLVLLDLDHFKDVNDAHGHVAGDELLAWAGRELRAEVRDRDVVGRLGGDEFALLLVGSDAAEAAASLDRIRQRLRPSAPCSLGRATFPQDAGDAAGLASVADRRLYADKAARTRRAPSPEAVAQACGRTGEAAPTVSARERRRHSLADPGWMSMAQTSVAFLYVLLFAAGNPNRLGMVLLCGWGFLCGLVVVLGADWLSRARLARPLMLAFTVSSFLSCAAIAVLDGGVTSTLGVGMLLSVPLLTLGMRPQVAAPVAVAAGLLYLLVAATGEAVSGWYVTVNLLGTGAVAYACALQGRAAARQRRRLTRLSLVDGLTGTLNRRGFAERFAAEIAGRRPEHGEAALLVLDLDRFKQLNDTYGHAAGDDLLRWVARTLLVTVDQHDVVGRLGGDEFVVLVTGAAAEAGAVAAQIQAALAERTEASVGAAVLDRDGGDFDSLYAAADARLYQMKARRRAAPPVRT
jgi:diguanylate cyclase (GGDEF)-like protein